jgi:hypothetical protein
LSRVFGRGLLHAHSEGRVVLDQVICQIVFRDVVEDGGRLSVSRDDDVFLSGRFDEIHRSVLEFLDARETHLFGLH